MSRADETPLATPRAASEPPAPADQEFRGNDSEERRAHHGTTIDLDAGVAVLEPEGMEIEPGDPDRSSGQLSTAAATWALFVGIGFLMLGNGLQGSLVGIRSQTEGFSTASTGLVMTAYFAGFLTGGRTVTSLISSVGHIRVFAALASTTSTAVLVYALAVVPEAWIVMRFITGFCMAGLYVVAESWINDLATNRTRGRLLAIYMVASMGGIAGGQFLLNAADPSGFELFVLASLLVSLALVPIALSASSSPPTRTPTAMPITALAKAVPTGLTVSFLVGMAHGALIGMGAVYATAAGLEPSQVALFLGAPMVGGVLFQVPIGWLSDWVPRRGVMFAVAVLAAACGLGVLAAEPGSPSSYGLMFVLGGASFPLYSLAIAHTNDWIEPSQIMGAATALVTVNGIGAMLGPLLAAGLILVFGNSVYAASLVLTHGMVVAFLGYRLLTHDGLPRSEQEPYRPFPARASAAAMALIARRRPLPRSR